jgi:hypothetical protein
MVVNVKVALAPSDKELQGITMKKLFVWKDSWPWLLLVGISSVLYIVALFAIISPTFNGPAFTVFTASYFAILTMAVVRYLLRAINLEKWNKAYTTRTGAAIIPSEGVDIFSADFKKIDYQIDQTIEFWDSWKLMDPRYANKTLEGIISGGSISIVPEPVPCRCAGPSGAGGLVVSLKDFVVTSKDPSRTLAFVKHEMSHICLFAFGIPESEHHMIFSKTGYC